MTAGESEDPVLLAVDEAVLAAGVEGNSGDKSGSEMSDAVVARETGRGYSGGTGGLLTGTGSRRPTRTGLRPRRGAIPSTRVRPSCSAPGISGSGRRSGR